MSGLFAYPARSRFARVVSKSKLFTYEKSKAKIRDIFAEQVAQIRWAYKLAPETVNLTASKDVPEIQIFQVRLKVSDMSENILKTIDKAIAFPIVFEVEREGEINVMASPKWKGHKPGQIYYQSGWQNSDAARAALPVATDLKTLYSQMLQSLMPYPARARENLFDLDARIAEIEKLEKTCDSLRAKIGREKQFNRRVALNDELKITSVKLAELING